MRGKKTSNVTASVQSKFFLLPAEKFELYLCIDVHKVFQKILIILFQAYAQKQQLADELYFRLVKAVTAKLNRTLSPTTIEPAAGRLFSALESTNHKSTIFEASNHTSPDSLQAHRLVESRERKTKSKDRQVVPSVLAGGGGYVLCAFMQWIQYTCKSKLFNKS